jgi:alkylation response protein AidB-like acyl-CoA dehydrogenase
LVEAGVPTSEIEDVASYRERAQAFLDSHLPRRQAAVPTEWGEGSDSVALLEESNLEQQLRELDAIRKWRAIEFDAGFGWIDGPEDLGGAGLSRSHAAAYRQLRSGYEVPRETGLGVSLGMVTPTLQEYGNAVVRERYLERLHRAEIVACQLFSEPTAGSDLASIRTRAQRDGAAWRITGQKVWTSGAQYSDIGEIICRTGTTESGRAGLSAFVVDMHAPGVTVRPLRQMTGGAAFNEVFLDDVLVEDDHRLGEVDDGWRVLISTLMYERQSIGGGGAAGGGGAGFSRVAQLVAWAGTGDDPATRQLLADLYVNMTLARSTVRRLARVPERAGVAGSVGKLLLTANQRRISDLVSHVLGPRLVADTGEWGTYAWSEYVTSVPGIRLAGGTDEIQRNTIAERGLGLMKEQPGRA